MMFCVNNRMLLPITVAAGLVSFDVGLAQQSSPTSQFANTKLSRQCIEILERYQSGVTPKTLTPLARHSALYVTVIKGKGDKNNIHCAWGTDNNRRISQDAKSQALAKCKRYGTSCVLVGLDGKVLDTGVSELSQNYSIARLATDQKNIKGRQAETDRSLAELKAKTESTIKDLTTKIEIAESSAKEGLQVVRNDFEILKSDLNSKVVQTTKDLEELNARYQQLANQLAKVTASQTALANRTSAIEAFLNEMLLPGTERVRWISSVPAIPVQQQQFCRIAERFRPRLAEIYKARNEIQKNALYRDRKKDMAALLSNKGAFDNWIVRVVEVKQASDGSAAVMLQLPCHAMLGSDACQRDGSRIFGTIGPNTLMFRELERTDGGASADFVVISGRIIYAQDDLPDRPMPIHAAYQPGSHCSSAEGAKDQDVFVAEIGYLARVR